MVEEKKIEVNVKDIVVETSYGGPKFESTEDIDAAWVVKMMDFLKD